ncbi:MAG: TraR/DksA family transcriptional regulator [Rhodanobacteraceae bacterium]
MSTSSSHLDKAFIETQRQRLVQLRTELLGTTGAVEVEETDLQNRFVENAQEREDDSQRLAILENDGALALRNMDRVRAVERALQKIDDGTYGFSDLSRKPIPRERLEAVPEAVFAKGEGAEDAS